MQNGLPVSGYKPQSQKNVDLVNLNKEIEERVLRILDDLGSIPTVDPRWLWIGRTSIEQGFMAVNRAVFQPGRAALPEDAPAIDPEKEKAAAALADRLGLSTQERPE